eukprot:5504551-Karenia_brevis.AAC.1
MKDSGVAQDRIKEQLGVPGVHCANGLLLEFVEGLPDQQKERMKAVIEKWRREKTWEYIYQHIPHCRLKKMYNGD